MEVKDKIMYHYHKNDFFDDMWHEGSAIDVDNNFNSVWYNNVKHFNIGVDSINKNNEESVSSFNHVIDYYLEEERFDKLIENKEFLRKLLSTAKGIISNTGVCLVENALEKYRQDFFENLPSRNHSIWLADESGLKFWQDSLGEKENLTLYKVSVTGTLFKSSDEFIPNSYLTFDEMYEQAKEYWHPDFSKMTDESRIEYLFQGKMKVLTKV